MKKYLISILAFVIGIVILVMIAIYWNEARKEVVFLCGNFVQGVSEHSVGKQLDTGNLLRYRTEPTPFGKLIKVDSLYSFRLYTCTIDIDANGIVQRAQLE